MNINGASRRSIKFFARHFEDRGTNERVELVETRGLSGGNAQELLQEMEALARLAPRCRNFFYHVNFNPCPHERLSEEQWQRAYWLFEQQRGIPDGTPRFVYEHEKRVRVHRHVAYLRVDLDTLKAFPDSLDWKVCHTASRMIERELGLRPGAGPLDRKPGIARPKRAPKSWEMFRGQRSGIDPRTVTREITALYRSSPDAAAFAETLWCHGYELVNGNRAFCILDRAGDVHSLARRIEGVRTRDLKEFMRGLDLSRLPTPEQAKARWKEPTPDSEHEIASLLSSVPTVLETASLPDARDEQLLTARAPEFVQPAVMEARAGDALNDTVPFPAPMPDQVYGRQEKYAPVPSSCPLSIEQTTLSPTASQSEFPARQRATGFGGRIKQFFRQVMRSVTGRVLTPEQRRRKREETERGFRRVAMKIMRRRIMLPAAAYEAIAFLSDTLDALNAWHREEAEPETNQGPDVASGLSPHP